MHDDYHFTQRKILNVLLFNNKLKYSEMKPIEMEGSQFTFHLSKLIDSGLVEKTDDKYNLTAKRTKITN